MASNAVQTIRNIGAGLSPIAIGMVLVSNNTLIPALPTGFHFFFGWSLAILGAVDLFNSLTGRK